MMKKPSETLDKINEALTLFQNDKIEIKFIMLAAARYFVRDRDNKDVDESRKWLHKIIKVDPKFEEAWVLLYKIEKRWGNRENAKEVLYHCMAECSEFGFYSMKREDLKNHIDDWHLTTEKLLQASYWNREKYKLK